MGSIQLTLLELHGDIRIGPKSLGLGDEDESTSASKRSSSSSESAEESGGSAGIALLVGLVFMAVLGLAARKRLGGGAGESFEEPVELAESDDM